MIIEPEAIPASPSPPPANRQVRVVARAAGIPTADIFQLVDGDMPVCPTDGALVRVLYAAVDPAMRGWLSAEKNYMTVPDGAVMRAHGVGRVVESNLAGYAPGNLVYGWFGWQLYCAAGPAEMLWKIDAALAPPPAWLGILGLNGLTAWVGLHHFGRPQAGQTILVSTAAGGVGGAVGQLAKAAALRAVGLTSTAEKVVLAEAELGFDRAIDYRASADLAADIAAACPNGVDIFFDNTAGWIADAVFPALNQGARVIQCGTAAIASWLPPPAGPRRERAMLVKRLSWHGFVVFDHADLFPEAFRCLAAAYAAGTVTGREEILDGLEAAPAALGRLYRGENRGRLCIKL